MTTRRRDKLKQSVEMFGKNIKQGQMRSSVRGKACCYKFWSQVSKSGVRTLWSSRSFGIWHQYWQATGLDAWASRVKCPARFVSHLHEIFIYIWVVYSLCFFCCLFITVTWWYVWCIEWASGNQEEVQTCLVTLWLFIISCYSFTKPL